MNGMFSTEVKKLATQLVEIVTKEMNVQSKTATSTKPISTKTIKDNYIQTLVTEVNKILPS